MYSVLPFWILRIGLAIFAGVVIALPIVTAFFGHELHWLKVISGGSSGVLALLCGFFGFTATRSPWRLLWRKYPRLNSWFFPDINGVWVGKTRSNWPVIDKLRHAANTDEGTLLRELTATPLQENFIAMEIKASLFKVHIDAYLTSKKATSFSVTAKARKKMGTVYLFYVYEQATPEADHTDEQLHYGAAELDFEPARLTETKGMYWTQRSWRQGFNTAGKLELRRWGERDEAKSLAEYAAEAVAGQDSSTS